LEGKPVFFQEDGVQDNQNVKFISYWDPNNKKDTEYGSIVLTLVDVDTAPKTSIGVATGTQHSMKKVGVEKLWGVTSDSGCGTPESRLRDLDKKGLIEDGSSSDSCGLHDLMSCFRPPCLLRNGSYGRQTDMVTKVQDTHRGSPEMITL
jgi:hypothetical protein